MVTWNRPPESRRQAIIDSHESPLKIDKNFNVMLQIHERNTLRAITADHLIQNYYFATLLDTEEILHYTNGYYHSKGEQYIKKYVRPIWGEHLKTHDLNEIINAHIIPQTYADREEFNPDINLTCLRNGVLNLQTRELLPHSPEYKFTFQIPVEWNPDAQCPAVDEFLQTTLPPDDIPVFWELAGYCLHRSYPIQKAFMLTGEGNNGKSTLINLLKAFLGKKNISSISLQQLVSNRFAASQLYGKHANLYADLNDQALRETGLFKMATGGDTLTGEKKFRDAFNFENYAKLIYSANKLPEVYDNTTAFFRRWVIINFPNTFDDSTADKNLLAKITTEEELSGMLRNAVIALKHLLEDGHFKRTETTEQIEERYIKLSDSIAAFAKDVLIEDVEAEPITRSELHNIYAAYCRKNDLMLKSQRLLTQNLRNHINVDTVKHNGQRAWRGIRIADEYAVFKEKSEDSVLQGRLES